MSKQKIKNSKDDHSHGIVFLFFLIGISASLIFGWIVFPKLLYSQKEQPIDFNHVLHTAEVDDGCESCHFFNEDGSFNGVPTNEQCISCHEEVQGEDPNEIKFVEQYIQKDKEVPWFVYSRQPNCAFFSHAVHVKASNLECIVCHGPVGESTSLRAYEENRITGYSRDVWGKNISGFKKNTWDRMKMDDCSSCHEEVSGTKDACFKCHK